MRLAILVISAAFASAVDAQVPGTRMTVDVSVTSVTLRGDTTGVTYVLYNRPDSQDSLMMFAVDAPGHVTSITRPDSLWSADTLLYDVQPVAVWGILGLLAPAATAPSIAFESLGLPGIATTWAQGKWPMPGCCDDDPPPPTEDDVLATHSVTGKTVGIDPWPSDRSVQGLLARLRGLTQSSCGSTLLWITDSSVCTQLLADIDAAESYRAAGAFSQASETLDQFVSLLGSSSTSFSPGVTSSAYWLLRPNVDVIKSLL